MHFTKNLSNYNIYRYFIILIIALTAVNLSVGSEIDDIRVAEDLQAEGKNQEAIAAYEEILENYPETKRRNEIIIKIARCYIRLGDDDSALKIYMRVITENPDSIDGAQATSLMISLFSQRYQYDEAIAMSKHLAQRYPKTQAAAMAIYRAAGFQYSQGKYDEAIIEYEAFLDDYPESTMYKTAFNRLISLYIRQSNFDKAERRLLDALSKDPSDTFMVRQLGLVYQKQGHYDRALEIYNDILKKNPDDIDVYERLGELYAEQGNKQKAIEEWSKITKLGPGQYSRHQMLAYILKSHGFYEQAATEYRKAIQLQPLIYYLYTQLADLYIAKRDFRTAIQIYVEALEKFPTDNLNRKRIIEPMFELCKFEELWDLASSELQEKMKTSTKNSSIHVVLADINFYKGNLDNSLQQFLSYAKSKPKGSSILFERAKLLERNSNYIYAMKFYQAIIDNFPKSTDIPYAMLNISKINSELGNIDEAISSLNALPDHNKINGLQTGDYQLNISAYMLMGDIYLNQKHDIQMALTAYVEAKNYIDKHPDGKFAFHHETPELYMKIANSYRLLGKNNSSMRILDELEKQYPSKSVNARVAKMKGDCSFSQGDFDNALKHYSEAIKWLKNEAWVNDSLERIILIKDHQDKQMEPVLSVYSQIEQLKKQGKYDEAAEICLSTLEIYAEADKLYMELGELMSLQNKYRKGISFYQTLVDSGSILAPEALFQIAELYHEALNEPEQAMANYSSIIEKYPDSVLVSEARKQMSQMTLQIESNLP